MKRLDWIVVGAYVLATALFAVWFARARKGRTDGAEYMVAGRRLSWWVAGIADVATADGADAFWIFAFFGAGFMAFYRIFWISSIVAFPLGVLFARYWRRLGLLTAGQLYEERYGGSAAARFRAVAAVWGALVNHAIVLAFVLRGFSQIMTPFLGWSPDLVLLVFCGSTLTYTLVSGLLAVAVTDVAQFALMMIGRVVLAVLVLHAAGGLEHVLDRVTEVRGADFLRPYPPASGESWGDFQVDPYSMIALFLAGVLGVAGTGSASVQRSLAARDERHAALGQMLGTVLSLFVRLLPMTVIGLAAIALLPEARSDTDLWADLVRDHAPAGVVGLLLVGVVAGYMSTLDGFLNFAASGVLNDFYRRHLRPKASDREQLLAGRVTTAIVVAIAYLWARVLIEKVDAAWINFINSVTGLFMLPLALLRWTWWRLNIWSEVVGFVFAFPLAYAVWFGLGDVLPAFKDRPYWQSFALLVGSGWSLILVVTFATRPERPEVLRRFWERARPPGLWGPIASGSTGRTAAPAERRRELWHDAITAASGVVLAASLCVGLGAFFARRRALCAALVVTALLAGWRFVRGAARHAAPEGSGT